MASVNALTTANRINIPAVGRIPGRGTAFLVSPGLVLTSTKAVGSRQEAARHKVVFFESGKKEPVEAALLPQNYYFAAAFPAHLDYCLVACDAKGTFNVASVKLPLVESEWPLVREGDTLLVVQHPVTSHAEAAAGRSGGSRNAGAAATAASVAAAAASSNAAAATASGDDAGSAAAGNADGVLEVKRFEEVLRRRDDLLYLRPSNTQTTAGCPCFNDNAALVGLQSQFLDEDTGEMVSRAVSIVTVVKHLFANGQLHRIQQQPLFQDVWQTWYVTNDTTRIVSIIANFRHRALVQEAVRCLCEHTSKRELVAGAVACGGTKVIVDALRQFGEVESLVAQGLRALWNISFGEEENRHLIMQAGGETAITEAMARFPENEEVQQFACVLLFNLTSSAETVGDWCLEASRLALAAMVRFHGVEVVQKFAIGFFFNMAHKDKAYARHVAAIGGLEQTAAQMERCATNEYLVEHSVKLIAEVARHAGGSEATKASLLPTVAHIVDAILRYGGNSVVQLHGNHALWALGDDPASRIVLLTHPRGVDALSQSIKAVAAHRSIP